MGRNCFGDLTVQLVVRKLSGKLVKLVLPESDIKAKMHQIRYLLGFPQTPLLELTALHQTP